MSSKISNLSGSPIPISEEYYLRVGDDYRNVYEIFYAMNDFQKEVMYQALINYFGDFLTREVPNEY